MKTYTLPAALLVAASVFMLGGALRSFEHAQDSARKLAEVQTQANLGRQSLAAAKADADMAQKKAIPVDKFLEEWTPELGADGNIEQIFGRLDTLAVNNLLSPSDKNFLQNLDYLLNGRALKTLEVNMNVAGDYYRTLNWLGATEDAFPMARFEQISFTSSGNSLSLNVHIVFPVKFNSP